MVRFLIIFNTEEQAVEFVDSVNKLSNCVIYHIKERTRLLIVHCSEGVKEELRMLIFRYEGKALETNK